MRIEQLYHSDAKHLNEVKQIYLASFPSDERRSFTIVRRYLKCSRRPFHIIAAISDDKVASFISYWEFAEFRYIEHFATDAALRGSGIGKRLIEDFLYSSQLPVVIEVEKPESPMSIRRIEYYSRLGFQLHDRFAYIQPPYSMEKNAVEMKIMTYGDVSADNLKLFTQEMRERVYNVKD